MTHIDPNDPRRMDMDPLTAGAGRHDPVSPNDPRFEPAGRSNWGIIGAIAAALVLVLVVASMMGGPAQDPQAPVQTSSPAPTQQSAPDPTTTGSTAPPAATGTTSPAPPAGTGSPMPTPTPGPTGTDTAPRQNP